MRSCSCSSWFCSRRSWPRSRCSRSCLTLSCSCCCCCGNDETSLDDEENDAEAVVDHNNHEVEILQFKIYIFCNQMSLTDIGDGWLVLWRSWFFFNVKNSLRRQRNLLLVLRFDTVKSFYLINTDCSSIVNWLNKKYLSIYLFVSNRVRSDES